MRPAAIVLTLYFISPYTTLLCRAQVTDTLKKDIPVMTINAGQNPVACPDTCSALFLNSVKDKDDWQIVSGPAINGLIYPVQAMYIKPFPSWEMDRYTADSSYFKNCDWMVLPDKKRVVNTITRLPIVFIKRFTTIAPTQLRLIVKMLYDNMAYLYIDSNRIKFNHRNPDINRFIKELQPELSNFVSIPATFNYSYNASFYAGDCYNMLLPRGDHILKIELFNNANELGCIIKGVLLSADNKKVFCDKPIKDEQAEMESVLVFHDEKAFPKNAFADTVYNTLMQAVKTGSWAHNLLQNDQDIASTDTLFLSKGGKINISPVFITTYYNGNKDSSFTNGILTKLITIKNTKNQPEIKKQWEKTLVFDASTPGVYRLEIKCETPADAKHKAPSLLKNFVRIIKVK